MAGTSAKTPIYLENLPQFTDEPCPPKKAAQEAYDSLWRYVDNNPPTLQDFASHAAQGKPRNPVATPCEWASCSMFFADNVTYQALPKPRKKFKYIARVSITADCGKSLAGGIHLHFWPFATYVPNVIEVVEL